jgi:hypothetical protein
MGELVVVAFVRDVERDGFSVFVVVGSGRPIDSPWVRLYREGPFVTPTPLVAGVPVRIPPVFVLRGWVA